MISLHNISTIAKYEARTLRRSWFFRLFAAGALFILTIMNIAVFSPVGEEDWELVAIPSSVPLINLYMLNIGQAIVVIFLASDFLKRDKKLDTNEVLYTRPVSNLEYITGKTWGILRLFLGLDILVLSIALLINIISTRMSVDLEYYIYYLLIISVPTIVFSLGLAFLLMSAIRNQAITFLVLLGIAALDMFYLWHRMGSLFDYMAFGIPVFSSGVTGFANPEMILNQRLFYFSLGSALILATVFLFKRLPQSRLHSSVTIVFLFLFTGAAAFFAINIYNLYNSNNLTKSRVIEINRRYEDTVFADVTSAEIDITHTGETISGKAGIILRNNSNVPLSKYHFSLNPGLDVTGTGELPFTRTCHIIEITPGKDLLPGESDSVTIVYKGNINEAFCYPDYSDNIRDNPYRIAMVNVSKKQAFLEDDYVLLTPEAHWYPVSGLNYYPSNPARIKIDFTEYTLRVKNEEGLTVVSQGLEQKDDTCTTFKPGSPMTGITLAIGKYESDTLMIDSVRYITYHFPGHDYYKNDLAEIRDTLSTLISGIMRELETNFSTPYPYNELSLVEVPVQFYSYPRENTQTRSEVQPAMVLLPERLSTIRNAGFSKQFTQQKKRMERNNQVITDKELQVRIFNNFIRNTFISGEDFRFINGVALNEPVRYRLGPSFYFFKNNFSSTEYPVINAVFESHLQKVVAPGQQQFPDISGGLTGNDRANLILREKSFSDLLKRNPGGDTLRIIVTLKGDWLFNLLREKAGSEEFNSWFRNYLDGNKFRTTDLKKLNDDIKKEFGFDFYPYLEDWYNGKDQPGFIFQDFRVAETVIGGRLRYHVTFTASNPEPVAGLFNVVFRTGGQGEGQQARIVVSDRTTILMQGRGMETSGISKIIFLGPGEASRIGILLDYEPRAMAVNTLISRNIPGQVIIPVSSVLKSRAGSEIFEGEENLASLPGWNDPDEIIVDNEDPGFNSGMIAEPGPLKKILGVSNEARTYETVRMYGVPEYWQPVVQSSYFGKYILSAVYTMPSQTIAERSVSWSTPIKEAGFYDIYTYIGKQEDRVTIRREGQAPESRGQEQSQYRDMHYRIYHDDGIEEISLDYEQADGGWNNLGRYYLSGDTAKVEMTNQSQGRVVIADAIKWVKLE